VKGYVIDWKKIHLKLNVTDPEDARASQAYRVILNYISECAPNGIQSVVSAQRAPAPGKHIGERLGLLMIDEGNCWGDDPEELKDRESPPLPKYLEVISAYLSGPEVVEFVSM